MNVFDIAVSIPADLRARFIHDVCAAAELAQEEEIPLEKIYGPVTFNERGGLNWRYTESWEAIEAPEEEHQPTGRAFTINHITDLLTIPVALLPECLDDIFHLSAAEMTALAPEQGQPPARYVWRDDRGLYI